jgi:hypothetical protein
MYAIGDVWLYEAPPGMAWIWRLSYPWRLVFTRIFNTKCASSSPHSDGQNLAVGFQPTVGVCDSFHRRVSDD